LKQVNNT